MFRTGIAKMIETYKQLKSLDAAESRIRALGLLPPKNESPQVKQKRESIAKYWLQTHQPRGIR